MLGFGDDKTLENRLFSLNILLEYFGNAKTPLNPNSSRFGKLIEIVFTELGTIDFVEVREFLLEKTRVVRSSENQGNFHIFYSIFTNLSKNESKTFPVDLDEEAVNLFRSTTTFNYLAESTDEFSSNLTLNELAEMLNEFKITKVEQNSIVSILLGILQLGNILFDEKNEIRQESRSSFSSVVRFFQFDEEKLRDVLLQSTLVARDETLKKPKTVVESMETRDAMAKAIYAKLFEWIVFALNRLFRDDFSSENKFSGERKKSRSISILDLFGFEKFQTNSYEQLCINVANEQFQYFYRQHIFSWEMKEFENEQIEKPRKVSRRCVLSADSDFVLSDVSLS